MHRRFAAEHRAAGWRGDPHGYGSAAAILLGDLMLTWSDEMFRRCGLPAERVAAALPYLDACRSEVVAGQFLDVVAQASGSSDVQTAMRVLHFKSAKYTVERPLHLGAALAGADEQLIGALSRFGLPLGEAFQLRDDVLGVFGDEGRTGKPAGDDLREGKRTVLLAHAHTGADDAQRDLLDRLVGQPDLDAGQVEQLRAVIVDTGALQAVEEHIGELHDAAVAALDEAPVPLPHARPCASWPSARCAAPAEGARTPAPARAGVPRCPCSGTARRSGGRGGCRLRCRATPRTRPGRNRRP
jgi:geranylgeranyl diphosphate synthase type I